MRTETRTPATRSAVGTNGSNHAGTDAAAHLAHELIDRAARHLEVSEENLRQRAADTTQALRNSLQSSRERGLQASESTRTLFRRHPVAAVGLALGAGALLALWSRSGRVPENPIRTAATPPGTTIPH